MQKFILFSEQRTGSNYCLGILSRNKRFLNLNELLNQDKVVGKPASLTQEDYRRMRGEDPVGLLRDHIYQASGWPKKTLDVIGFKYQYQNLFNKKSEDLLPKIIEAFPDAKAVHLVRRNMFERYVSKVNATKTSQYFVNNPQDLKPAPDPYPIKVAEARLEMRKYLQDVRTVDRMLKPFKSVLKIYYEDITEAPEVHFKPVFDMLDLKEGTYEARSLKQSLEPRFQIKNYALLRERFKGTKFESCFHDGPGY